ncbi:MAG: hypothetical protein ACQEP7_06810 [bacterium]
MRAKIAKIILLFVIVTVITIIQPSSINAAARYSAVHSQTGKITNWFGESGLVIKIGSGDEENIVRYRADTTPGIIYLEFPAQKTAIKFTEPEIRRVAAHLNLRYEQLKKNLDGMTQNMSEKEKQKVMENLPLMKKIEIDTPPEVTFNPAGDTTWEDYSATRGHFQVDGDTRGEAIILDSSPLEISDEQRQVINNFQKLLDKWIEIVRRQQDFVDGENPYRQTRNLLGKYLLKVAEFREDNNKYELKEWENVEVEPDFFHLPSGYTIQSLEASLLQQ